jgi:hypothetical protein
MCICLHNVLVVECAKLRTINTKYAPIIIGDALEAKSRVSLPPLGSIVVTCRACQPFDMNDIHQSTCIRQTNRFLESCHMVKLPNTIWKFDVLLLHIHKGIEKYKENLTNL